jgi:transcriptional regulator GlxA family with amidase domain
VVIVLVFESLDGGIVDIAFVLYPNMTALDLVGPYDVLGHVPGVTCHFVAAGLSPVRADAGLQLVPTTTFADLAEVDVVVVPGGDVRVELADGALVSWLAGVRARWMTSVCTGSALLAEAGLLAGRRATTHWAFPELLTERGVAMCSERVVRDGSVITAAGVSAGIDMALTLTGLEFGDDMAKRIQLVIEYDPAPPYDCGSALKAPAEMVEQTLALLHAE